MTDLPTTVQRYIAEVARPRAAAEHPDCDYVTQAVDVAVLLGGPRPTAHLAALPSGRCPEHNIPLAALVPSAPPYGWCGLCNVAWWPSPATPHQIGVLLFRPGFPARNALARPTRRYIPDPFPGGNPR